MNDRSTLHGIGLGFALGELDRLSERRDDEELLASLRSDERARTLVIAGDTPVLRRLAEHHAEARFGFDEAAALGEPREVALLGRDARGPLYATLLDGDLAPALKAREDLLVLDMRSIAVKGIVPEAEVAALGTGKSILDWHARHRHCARCGAPTRMVAAGWRRECDACGAQHFLRTDPVAIMLVHRGDACLLARQPRFVPGMFSCLAGFVEPGETIEAAVRREVGEEVGLRAGPVRYLLSQPWPFPSSLMIGCLCEALSEAITLDRAELEDGRWFSREETRALLEGRHEAGLSAPPPIAIAHHLMRAWVEGAVA